MFSYKIEEETIDDLLTIGYFKDLQGVVNINDVILVLDLKKDGEYKNIEYLIVKDLDIRKGITVSRLDASYLPSNDIPLTSSDNGEVGTSVAFARGDHRHPKAIATETERGEIIIANQEEINIGEDNTKAITPLKNKTYFDNQQATDEEINLGEDIKKYINPKQIKAVKDNLKVIIENNYNILDGKIDVNKEEVDNNIALINEDINNINNNKADINLNNITEDGKQIITSLISENTALKTLENVEINSVGQQKIFYSMMPDYEAEISQSYNVSGQEFTINEDGFILISAYSQGGNATRHINLYKKINNEFINIYYFVCDSGLVYIQSPLFFVKKDEIIKCQGGTSSQNFKFYPLKQL